jgi:hypothetical protein
MKCTRLRLPAGDQDLGDGRFDHRRSQLDAAQAAPRELAQERGPKDLSLGRANIYAEQFAAAIAVDRNRN